MVPCGLSPDVGEDLLNFSLVYEDLCERRFVVDPLALELGARVLSGGYPEVPWMSEMEFRDVSLSKLLSAVGMEAAPANPGGASQATEPAVEAAAAADGEGEDTTAAALRRTLAGLACGCPAPALPPGLRFHVCIVHDEAVAGSAVGAIRDAIESAFEGAKVAVPPAQADEAEYMQAVQSSRRVLVYLTRGLLSRGSPQSSAVAAALAPFNGAAASRIILVHETAAELGGTASFGDYVTEALQAVEDGGRDVRPMFSQVTSIPWLHDPSFVPVCGLRLVLEGILDEPSGSEDWAGIIEDLPNNTHDSLASRAVPEESPAVVGETSSGADQEVAAAQLVVSAPASATMEERLEAALAAAAAAQAEAEALREQVRSLDLQARIRAALCTVTLGPGPCAGAHASDAPGAVSQDEGGPVSAPEELDIAALVRLLVGEPEEPEVVPMVDAEGDEKASVPPATLDDAVGGFGSPLVDTPGLQLPVGNAVAAVRAARAGAQLGELGLDDDENAFGGFFGNGENFSAARLGAFPYADELFYEEQRRPQTSPTKKKPGHRETLNASLRALCYA